MFILEVFGYGIVIYLAIKLVKFCINNLNKNDSQGIEYFKTKILIPSLANLERDIRAYATSNDYTNKHISDFIVMFRGVTIEHCLNNENYNQRIKALINIQGINKNLAFIIYMQENMINAFNRIIPSQFNSNEDEDFAKLSSLFGLAMIGSLKQTLANYRIANLDLENNILIESASKLFNDTLAELDMEDEKENDDISDKVFDYLDAEYETIGYVTKKDQDNSNSI